MSSIRNRDTSPGPSVASTSNPTISSTRSAILPLHLIPATPVPSTPLPEPGEMPASSAWDPSSHTPLHGDGKYGSDSSCQLYLHYSPTVPPPYWLADSCFNGMRLSLRVSNSTPDFHNGKFEDKRAEFKVVVGETVTVKILWETVQIPFKYLVPIIPSQAQELVVAFDGPHKGKKFKVMVFKIDVCGCSNFESATRRRRVDVEIPTNQLVVAHP